MGTLILQFASCADYGNLPQNEKADMKNVSSCPKGHIVRGSMYRPKLSLAHAIVVSLTDQQLRWSEKVQSRSRPRIASLSITEHSLSFAYSITIGFQKPSLFLKTSLTHYSSEKFCLSAVWKQILMPSNNPFVSYKADHSVILIYSVNNLTCHTFIKPELRNRSAGLSSSIVNISQGCNISWSQAI